MPNNYWARPGNPFFLRDESRRSSVRRHRPGEDTAVGASTPLSRKIGPIMTIIGGYRQQSELSVVVNNRFVIDFAVRFTVSYFKSNMRSCATTGSRTASSSPTTISSITAARLGTNSSINPGASCQSVYANGRMGFDQWDLV